MSIVWKKRTHTPNQTTQQWLEEFYFKEDKGRALIIQAKESYAVFFLIPTVHDNPTKRKNEESTFHQLLSFLKYLKAENYITQTRGKSSRTTEMFFVQDGFIDPQTSNHSSIILNSKGEFTNSPDTIQDSNKEVVYKGITYDHDVFDLILSTCTGTLFVSESIKDLKKTTNTSKEEEQKKKEEEKNKKAQEEQQKKQQKKQARKKVVKTIFTVLGIVALLLVLGVIYRSSRHLKASLEDLHTKVDSSAVVMKKYASLLDQKIQDSLFNTNMLGEISSTIGVSDTSKDTLYGIDISKWNGDILADITAHSRLSFIICRATYGKVVDNQFEHNWSKIQDEDLIRGAYHFYRTKYKPLQQAKIFVDAVGDLAENDMPLVLDIEEGSLHKNNTNPDELLGHLIPFLNYVEEFSGKKPIIYSSLSFANTYLKNSHYAEYRLWLAEYNGEDAPEVPTTWEDKGWFIWQKTDSYELDGEKVDYDVFVGTEKELVAN